MMRPLRKRLQLPLGDARQRRLRAGFTLLEILISASLLAVILIILWGAFANAYKTRDYATMRFDTIRASQAALRRMQREISMAFVTKIGEIPTNEDGRITYQTAFIGTRDRLDFTNFAHMRTRVGEVASEQAEISYYLRSQRGRDGRLQQNLVRREQAPIDDDPEEGGVIFTLLEDVESLEFEYWRPDRDIAGDAWERSWDTRQTGVVGLPPRVRVTVQILNPTCRLIQSDSDRRRCQSTTDNLVFRAQAEIQLTLPIGFATDIAAIADAELLRQEQAQQTLDIQNVQADESDEPPAGEFDDQQQEQNR